MPTIYAAATPPGVSGVAVVRISGPDAFSAAERLGARHALLSPRFAKLQRLKDPDTGHLLDQALVLAFPGPASFTGEDVVELHCHGSKAVIDAVLRALSRLSLRPAEPGEFSRRALQNGKMDLLGAESLDAVLHASDRAQLQIAQGQAGLQRQVLFDGYQQDLISLMAGCEALIDFPDDDLPEALLVENARRLTDLKRAVDALLARSLMAQRIDGGLEVMLVGPPNAGKSTLLNAFAGYDRAIVTKIAGTTRDFVELDMTLGPFQVRFVDTAGLHDAPADEVEALGMERTRSRLQSAALILNMAESGQKPFDGTGLAEAPIWPLETKVKSGLTGTIGAGEPGEPGVATLLEGIEFWLIETYGTALEGVAFHKERQVFHVKQLQSALDQAQAQTDFPELQGESLRHAAQALGQLSGKIHVEDVLDRLFAGFCIGK